MIRLGHFYPELLNLYGDRGNIITLVKRCQWRNIEIEVEEISLGVRVDLSRFDILFLGGGSDREQILITNDLRARLGDLRAAIDQGVIVLAICGGYQLLGKYYRTLDGREIPGLAIIDFHTLAGKERLVGDAVVKVEIDEKTLLVVGFENHSGRTFIGNHPPLGHVKRGHGNNGLDRGEGIRYKNVFGSYLHGPLLPKNPDLADHLLSLALKRRGLLTRLSALEDKFEWQARKTMLKRMRVWG